MENDKVNQCMRDISISLTNKKRSRKTNDNCKITKSNDICEITKLLQNITTAIKNKYVCIDDLILFTNEINNISQIAHTAINEILNNPLYSLDCIMPVIRHLDIFLNVYDIGSLALVSKQLYTLLIQEYTKDKIELYILLHYLKNPHYDHVVNINFDVKEKMVSDTLTIENQNIMIPIHIDVITLKKLRLHLGPKKYYENFNAIFFKNDIVYIIQPLQHSDTSVYCIFCEKSKIKKLEKYNFYPRIMNHDVCMQKYMNDNNLKYLTEKRMPYSCQYFVCPELEYIIKKYNNQKI